MKKQRPHTVRATSRNSSRAGSIGHAKKRALHRQIKAARALHHKIVLHPLSVIAMLAIGVLIAGWTLGATADTYSVTAKVAAAPLTGGAVITNPADGFVTQASQIAVTGTCPDNSYAKLTRNGVFSGVAVCTGNTFSIQTPLTTGINTILAQDYNITDDPGPTTTGITVTYNPPATPPSAIPTGSSSASITPTSMSDTGQPLLLMSDFRFHAFTLGSKFSWTLSIGGGVAPYAVHTTWGDKQSSEQAVPSAQNVTIEHAYAHPGYYPVIVQLTDAKNTATVLQLAALIQQPGAAGLFGITSGSTGGTTSLPSLIGDVIGSKSWLLVAWPAYTVLILMAVSFWLGERQELRRLLTGRPAHTASRLHYR